MEGGKSLKSASLKLYDWTSLLFSAVFSHGSLHFFLEQPDQKFAYPPVGLIDTVLGGAMS